jgi:hypothetical protein
VTDVSEVLTASIIRAMSKPHAEKHLVEYEQAGLGQNLAGPMDEGVRIKLRTDKAREPMGEQV